MDCPASRACPIMGAVDGEAKVRVLPCGDRALLAEVPDLAAVAALRAALERSPLQRIDALSQPRRAKAGHTHWGHGSVPRLTYSSTCGERELRDTAERMLHYNRSQRVFRT